MGKGDFIKEFWNTQAQKHKESHWASWGDNYMIELEIQFIQENLKAGDTVLDVGCANGYSTIQQLLRLPEIDIVGIDVTVDILKNLQKELKDNKFAPSPILLKMIEENRLGRKTKKGFYNY